jgi:hypothetical protein
MAMRGVRLTDSAAADRSRPRVRLVPTAPLIAEAIRRLHAVGSLGDLCEGAPTAGAAGPHPVAKVRTPC